MIYPIIASMLMLFWLVLSGHFNALFISFGVVSVILVLWLLHRLDRVDQESAYVKPGIKLFNYMFWLIWNVIRANIRVAKIIWDPNLPIEPKWQKLTVNLETDLQKTFYANSITLMPGTLTTDVEQNSFMIHALSQKDMDELKTGDMERKIRASGI